MNQVLTVVGVFICTMLGPVFIGRIIRAAIHKEHGGVVSPFEFNSLILSFGVALVAYASF